MVPLEWWYAYMRLSKDYDGFGKFANQVFIITISGFIPTGIIMFILTINMGLLGFLLGFISYIPFIIFFVWGMGKQTNELIKRNYAFHDTWVRTHPEDKD